MTRALDYAPLRQRIPLRDRWREVRSHAQLSFGVVFGVLLVLVSLGVTAVVALDGSLGDDGGVTALLVLFGAVGVWVLVAMPWMAGDGAALRALARANDLELVEPGFAPHYAGSVFAQETHVLHTGIRTRDDGGFVEVGERFPATANGQELRQNLAVYLRVRLSGPAPVASSGDELLTSAERLALMRWAGIEETGLEVEVEGDELTVLGRGRLRPRRTGRVEDGFALAETLKARGEEVFVPRGRAEAAAGRRTTSGVTLPALERPEAPAPSQPRHPLAVAAGLVGLVALGGLAFALVMSVLESIAPRSSLAAAVVVGAVLPGVYWVVSRFFHWVMGRPAR